MASIELSIQGMNCGHCVKAVQTAIAAQPGIVSSDVKIGSASVSFDGSLTTREKIAQAVEEEGFKVVAG